MQKHWIRIIKLRFGLVALTLIVLAAGALGYFYWFSPGFYPATEAMAWPVVGRTIILDPGHGGFDPGAVGVNGSLEKDINLQIAQKLGHILAEAGAIVIYTRNTDAALGNTKREDMHKRIEIAKSAQADLFISVQANSIPNASLHGAQVFYAAGSVEGQKLATCVQNEIVAKLKNTKRQALVIKNAYVIKSSPMPAIIIEVGFLSNAEEAALLNDANYQTAMAWNIYGGIIKYFAQNGQEPWVLLPGPGE